MNSYVARYLTTPYRVLLLDEQEHYDFLIAGLSEVLAREPGHGIALNNRGLAYSELGMVDEALADFERGSRTEAPSPLIFANQGDLFGRLGWWDEAQRAYATAIALDPADATLRRCRAHALHELARYEEACVEYDVAIALDPAFEPTRRLRSQAAAHLPYRLE